MNHLNSPHNLSCKMYTSQTSNVLQIKMKERDSNSCTLSTRPNFNSDIVKMKLQITNVEFKLQSRRRTIKNEWTLLCQIIQGIFQRILICNFSKEREEEEGLTIPNEFLISISCQKHVSQWKKQQPGCVLFS